MKMTVKEKIAELESKAIELENKKKEFNIQAQKTLEKKEKLEAALNMQETYLNTVIDALVMGTDGWFVSYGEVAPYSKGYYINSKPNGVCVWGSSNKSIYTYKTEYKAFFTDLSLQLIEYLVSEKEWEESDFEDLKEKVNKDFQEFPTVDDTSDPIIFEYGRPSHIANGYERKNLMQIINGKAEGSYYSMTPSNQNKLSRWLVATKFMDLDSLRQLYFEREISKEDYEFSQEIKVRHTNTDEFMNEFSGLVNKAVENCFEKKDNDLIEDAFFAKNAEKIMKLIFENYTKETIFKLTPRKWFRILSDPFSVSGIDYLMTIVHDEYSELYEDIEEVARVHEVFLEELKKN